ncbi:hypothetical protein HK102_005959 [Quaeritorhiza haematococci]|nr:hypothetical protein HK102_005959 [Quaeritorhiza haematococci]
MNRKFAFIQLWIAASLFASQGVLAAPITGRSQKAARSPSTDLTSVSESSIPSSSLHSVHIRGFDTRSTIAAATIPNRDSPSLKLASELARRQNIDIQQIIGLIQQIPFADIINGIQQIAGLFGGAAGGAGGGELQGANFAGANFAAPPSLNSASELAANSLATQLARRQNVDIQQIIGLIQQIPFADIINGIQQIAGLFGGAAGGAGGGELQGNNFAGTNFNLAPPSPSSSSSAGNALATELARRQNIDIQQIIGLIQQIPFADIVNGIQQIAGLFGGAAGANLAGGEANFAGPANLNAPLNLNLNTHIASSSGLQARSPQNVDVNQIIGLIQQIPFADIVNGIQQIAGLFGNAAGGAAGGAGGEKKGAEGGAGAAAGAGAGGEGAAGAGAGAAGEAGGAAGAAAESAGGAAAGGADPDKEE